MAIIHRKHKKSHAGSYQSHLVKSHSGHLVAHWKLTNRLSVELYLLCSPKTDLQKHTNSYTRTDTYSTHPNEHPWVALTSKNSPLKGVHVSNLHYILWQQFPQFNYLLCENLFSSILYMVLPARGLEFPIEQGYVFHFSSRKKSLATISEVMTCYLCLTVDNATHH